MSIRKITGFATLCFGAFGCLAAFRSAASAPDGKTLRMRVGAVTETRRVAEIPPGGARGMNGRGANGDCLLLRIVVPDDRERYPFRFAVLCNGRTIHRRGGEARGFGRRSFFIPIPRAVLTGSKRLRLSVVNEGESSLHVESLRLLRRFDRILSRPLPPEDFTLSLLVNRPDPDSDRFREIGRLLPAPGVRTAFSTEIYYASRSPEQLRAETSRIRSAAERHQLPFVSIPCSWWAGTPAEVARRIDFQQVCWSDTDTFDEGQPLRDLLGDRWNLRYGLTVPNRWSNTPWQTMNHPELNALRRDRLIVAMREMEASLGDLHIGSISENEPAYWAGEFPDENYPVKRTPLWADFNPHTVKAAQDDGVALDPTDGLGLEERLWLHANLSRYIQTNIDTIRKAGYKGTLYSHALLAQMFPMEGTGRFRPYADVARVRGAKTGIETLWKTDMEGLRRVREWGPWACVNREEGDGMGLEFHVAMLRADYMLGAGLFNSYNWDAINDNGRAINYMNQFLAELASDGMVVVTKAPNDAGGTSDWREMAAWEGAVLLPGEFPWFNEVSIEARAEPGAGPMTVEVEREKDGSVVAYRVIDPGEGSSDGRFVVPFGDLANLEQGDSAILRIRCDGRWRFRMNGDRPFFSLRCNLREERARSCYLIEETRRR